MEVILIIVLWYLSGLGASLYGDKYFTTPHDTFTFVLAIMGPFNWVLFFAARSVAKSYE